MRSGAKDSLEKPLLEFRKEGTKPETVTPLIAWTRNKQTGEAEFFCGQDPSRTSHDTLVGQLVVSAFSPHQRDQMPERFSVRSSDEKLLTQQMFEAQVPLLVRMPEYSQNFLKNSPVISGFEKLET